MRRSVVLTLPLQLVFSVCYGTNVLAYYTIVFSTVVKSNIVQGHWYDAKRICVKLKLMDYNMTNTKLTMLQH